MPKQTIVIQPTAVTKAKFYFFEDGKEIYNTSANIGRNGVAEAGQKREGDGKTPSGVYDITALFGYGDVTSDMPYIKVDEKTICVDDAKSVHYNKIIDKPMEKVDYASFEDMRRNDEQYAFGAVINYNENGTKNAGSCIFIHIEKTVDAPTAGCVSLSMDDMKRLFFGENRLQASKKPTIAIAQTDEEFERILANLKLR